jgi:hypothetical protein
VWADGFWSAGFWADGFWEGSTDVAAPPAPSNAFPGGMQLLRTRHDRPPRLVRTEEDDEIMAVIVAMYASGTF